ncbi:major facilitator superfamily domain-containing protein [Coniella lustricola]|uniref:Major facilitator superfamily domain-containing protein n=1 Tax=Coniella lustricola TaxID=2025994 RepID=A0A2T3ADC8_9PEZI|nr:major facilitator superfamily domain-containing protein [Coniella lustricola]
MAVNDATDEQTPLLANSSSSSRPGGGTSLSNSSNSNGNSNSNSNSKSSGSSSSSSSSLTCAQDSTTPPKAWLTRVLGPPNTLKVLLAGFLISFSFSFTQVPIFYVFHLMECDVYYASHPPYTGTGDRCALNEIAAGTATQFSILGMSTTFCGTLNLFVTGWTVKQWGPRFALVLQTLIPAIRVATQVLGVLAGGAAGETIIQATQLITILGGPAGYILVVNTIAGEVVPPMRRTAVFGQLQGCIMLGQAIAYLLGGMTGDAYGIRMPFQVAFFLFLASSVYAATVLPYISPESLSDAKPGSSNNKKKKGAKHASGVSGFLAPLRIMAPQRIRLAGRVTKHRGVLFLCCGIFLGVLATGYAPLLIQMYATAYFDFTQADNGWLMSGNALVRSFFLFFIFPRIIATGRRWWISGDNRKAGGDTTTTTTTTDNALARIPSRPEELEAPVAGNQAEQDPLRGLTEEEERAACRFDLFFLRWSLLVDGVLTAGAALCTKKWHIYLAAFLLPFGSGSAPAGKGVITEMCAHSQRTDALNAVTLVENIARLATQGFFGFMFSALAEIGKPYLTFYANAAVAVIGMAVLYLSHFPPLDATMEEDDDDDEVDGDGDENVSVNGGDRDPRERETVGYRDAQNPLVRVTSHETDR